jgi:hypothetical protein
MATEMDKKENEHKQKWKRLKIKRKGVEIMGDKHEQSMRVGVLLTMQLIMSFDGSLRLSQEVVECAM